MGKGERRTTPIAGGSSTSIGGDLEAVWLCYTPNPSKRIKTALTAQANII